MGIKPKALIERPRLKPKDKPYLEAFYDLSSGRAMAEVLPPIPTSEVLYYADRVLGLGPSDEQNHFLRLMRMLDATYLEVMSEKK